MDPAGLRVAVTPGDDETVISLSGDLDTSTVDLLSNAVHEGLDRAPARLVVDLSGLTFCDSRGLGTLVVLSRTAQIQQTVLVFRNPTPFFDRMLDVTGVRQALTIAHD
jgi:anti-sigma B factor antagonist